VDRGFAALAEGIELDDDRAKSILDRARDALGRFSCGFRRRPFTSEDDAEELRDLAPELLDRSLSDRNRASHRADDRFARSLYPLYEQV
jgi:hypothetical protein